MPKRLDSCVEATIAMLVMSMTAFGGNQAFAATDCLSEPGHQAPSGGHWYYRLDRVSHRKCWYLAQPVTATPPTLSQPATPQPDYPPATSQPAFSSFFNSLMSNLPGTPRSEPQFPQADERTIPDDRDPGMAGMVKRESHRQTTPAEPAPKPRQMPAARSQPATGDKQPVRPLSEKEREALFEEFLQWRESHRP